MAVMTQETKALTRFELALTGINSISLTEWDTTSEPAMAEGSLLEIGNSFFEARGGDLDVGDLAACADGLVYLKCAYTDGTLFADNVAPTWSTDKQGLYDGDDRCYASLLKAGASYTQKTIWVNREYGYTATGLSVALGANADRAIRLATDATITWDEANDRFVLNKNIYIPDNIITPILKATTSGYIHTNFPTEDSIFDLVSPSIPNVNDWTKLSGSITGNEVSHAIRTSTTIITIYGINTGATPYLLYTRTITDGSSSTTNLNVVSIAW